MSPDIVPSTEQEIERALEIISRAAQARKAAGITDRKLLAFQEQKKKNKALATKCDELQESIYQRLATALSNELKELFGLHDLIVLAPYTVNQKTFSMFRASHRKAKKLLALQS
jgi:hypothetical protein